MKVFLKVSAIAAVVMLAAGAGVSVAAAQGQTPPPPGWAGPCQGEPAGGAGAGILSQYEDVLHAKLADALGMSASDFEAARDSGQTLFQIAQDQGVDLEAISQAMADGRQAMIDQALSDGVITQSQAEWLSQRGGAMGRMGQGTAGQGGGRHGSPWSGA